MTRSGLALATFVALVSVGAAAMPAAAVVDAADHVVWRFPAPGGRGLGLMRERSSDTTLLAEAVGLAANSAYRYVGSARSCSRSHRASDVIWARRFESNAKGAAMLDTTVPLSEVTSSMRSIRLFRGSIEADCTAALRYGSDGAAGSADAYAHLSGFGARALVFVDLGSPNDRLTAAGHGFIAFHGYRLVAASVACPTMPSTSTHLFQKSGLTNSLGIMWRHDTGSNLTATSPRSIQLFNPSNDRVACANTRRLVAVP